ncbi:MAG: hypothetical protein FWG10_07140 [Eubacteriaceae bacterium]|nr:hypothetical protein [Eubacteriaceae bacterium]
MKLRKMMSITCLAIMMLSVVALYSLEYEFTNESASLVNGIKAMLAPTAASLHLDIIGVEIHTTFLHGVNSQLTAHFIDQGNGIYNGSAQFMRGVNLRYRITNVEFYSPSTDTWHAIAKPELFVMHVGCFAILVIGCVATKLVWP